MVANNEIKYFRGDERGLNIEELWTGRVLNMLDDVAIVAVDPNGLNSHFAIPAQRLREALIEDQATFQFYIARMMWGEKGIILRPENKKIAADVEKLKDAA